jgi:UDP-3-O-[3-hydroxymyristoyl] glucosamine N-acyltransferase
MGKRGFFDRPSGLTVADIISLTGAEAASGARVSHLITDVAPIDLAGPTDLTFIESSKYADALATTHAGACLMPQRFEGRAPPGLIALYTQEPYRAFVAVHSRLYPQSLRPTSMFEASDIAPGATIHPTAQLESGITVDPGVVIGPRAEIGAGSIIAATAVIGPDVMIGRDCVIGAGCSITHALIGDRVVIHPGCRIGQDGFGYVEGRPAASSSRTMSKSAPARRSIAAASATP